MAAASELFKIPLLLSFVVAANKGIYSSPTPTPTTAEQSRYGKRKFLEQTIIGSIPISWYFVILEAICETLAILSRRFPSVDLASQLLSLLVRDPSAPRSTSALTLTFVVGWTLFLSGSLLRLACYRYLGKHFTYLLSIQKDHELITTGPYAIVRHPAYSGSLLGAAGLFLIEFGEGSWLREARFTQTSAGQAFVALWGVHTVMTVVMAVRRMAAEDEMLRKEFGKDWEAWARRTPCSLIPGVY